MADKPPFAGSYTDRHGKTRWRFRRGKKTVALPGQPGDEAFARAYEAALSGQQIPKTSQVVRIGGIVPRSLRAAWIILKTETSDWKELGPVSKNNQTGVAERFLTTTISEDSSTVYGDMPIEDMRRRHIKAIIARWADTPHAAAMILRLLRKLTGVALDQEWIENDPTYRIKYRPGYRGHKAWPADARAKFEARWPTGTTPRLAYALALYFGHRRSDVAAAEWADIEDNAGSDTTQKKTGKVLWIPIHPALRIELQATRKRGDHILMTQYGRRFSDKSLTGRMADWTKAAGLPKGYTLHGLRKTLGKTLAEGGATTREIMAVLGHDDIKHTELYTKEAEQKLLAKNAMKKIGKLALRSIKGGKRDG